MVATYSAVRVVGMDGNQVSDEMVAYLSRLTGEPVSADQPLRLRSVQRAAFASWSRRQNLPISFVGVASGAPFSVRDLLTQDREITLISPPIAPETNIVRSGQGVLSNLPVATIGIDIEEVEYLPQADDYREHPFFQDNFTPEEIAYCIRQSDVRASLCGTWAAKEAIIKSGLVNAALGQLRLVEISRDGFGRPNFPNCSLSISHTASTAVAVCIATAKPLERD
jgi:phosphopantetheine--protein transferase-like protein